MLSNPLTVDGVAYSHIHVVSITRNFQVLDGDNAGRVLNGAMVRDVIGTYYNYSVTVDADANYPEEYDALYQVLSAPTAQHTVILPYGQSTLSFAAYVTNGSDTLEYMEANKNRWNTLTYNFIAMLPQRV